MTRADNPYVEERLREAWSEGYEAGKKVHSQADYPCYLSPEHNVLEAAWLAGWLTAHIQMPAASPNAAGSGRTGGSTRPFGSSRLSPLWGFSGLPLNPWTTEKGSQESST